MNKFSTRASGAYGRLVQRLTNFYDETEYERRRYEGVV
jgi:hypothetical protein